jgi:uncharacterized membrane protein required for colicin V production
MPTSLTTVSAVVSTITAIVGFFVAYLAYRGYRRNESQRMRALSVGILCIAVLPYLVVHIVGRFVNTTDATMIVIITLLHAIGLAAIYTTFE